MAVSSVLNMTRLLLTVEDDFRGRVFATLETLTWGVMMLSMMGAGAASEHYSPRTIGAWAGVLSSTTAIFWAWTDSRGRLPEPKRAAQKLRKSKSMVSRQSDMLDSLEGKVVLVTGAAKRIGRGIAGRLSDEGARVLIHYHRSELKLATRRPKPEEPSYSARTLKACPRSFRCFGTFVSGSVDWMD